LEPFQSPLWYQTQRQPLSSSRKNTPHTLIQLLATRWLHPGHSQPRTSHFMNLNCPSHTLLLSLHRTYGSALSLCIYTELISSTELTKTKLTGQILTPNFNFSLPLTAPWKWPANQHLLIQETQGQVKCLITTTVSLQDLISCGLVITLRYPL
jgi:hypothetical protein